MKKPTFPPPWRVDDESRIVDANGATVAYLAARFAGEAPDIVAEVGRRLCGAIQPDPAAEALRAAAPDLYEALAAVVDLHDNETPDISRMSRSQVQHQRECWNRARAALGKAREGAPDRQPPVELVRPD